MILKTMLSSLSLHLKNPRERGQDLASAPDSSKKSRVSQVGISEEE